MQFLGEDQIDHTGKDADLDLFIGNAFDITGERSTQNQEEIRMGCTKYDMQVKLKNSKNADVTVKVIEHWYGENELKNANIQPAKKDAYTYEFNVPVPHNGDATLTYTAFVGDEC